jgi:hypothetical protein
MILAASKSRVPAVLNGRWHPLLNLNEPMKSSLHTNPISGQGNPQRVPVTFIETPARTVAISQRCDFLTLEGVRSIMGLSTDQALEQVEDGKLLWVFNLGTKADGQKKNALRVWVNSVREPKAVERMALPEVVALIVGDRQFFTRGGQKWPRYFAAFFRWKLEPFKPDILSANLQVAIPH